ncbi:hypothetical protein [Paludibacterium paludis]|uniref:Uncharacterized protein n=1 Tax=Paludibacterium paludis TaxID=1225769 RepID=A0A918NWI1_9NEIS|nr:hypothetical protein [Paludibacterium paludis]GGY02893.1 hypothetical protein GCM10011289_01310 [Paludibacterium paludis]
MDLIAAGCHAALPWLAQRLKSRGYPVTRLNDVPEPLTRLGGEVSCLIAEDTVIALAPSSAALALRMEAECLARGLRYAELTGPWQSYGTETGFILMTGTDESPPPVLPPILDALAPVPGGWLRTGPAGSACYTARVLDTLVFSCALASQASWAIPGEALRPPDWETFLARLHQLADQLMALSLDYLGEERHNAEADPASVLADFARPPAEQAHFAGNLARVLVLALRQGKALEQLYLALAASHGNDPPA